MKAIDDYTRKKFENKRKKSVNALKLSKSFQTAKKCEFIDKKIIKNFNYLKTELIK
jgi:hypothetical protein